MAVRVSPTEGVTSLMATLCNTIFCAAPAVTAEVRLLVASPVVSPVLMDTFGGWVVAVMMGGLAVISLLCAAALPETLPRLTAPR